MKYALGVWCLGSQLVPPPVLFSIYKDEVLDHPLPGSNPGVGLHAGSKKVPWVHAVSTPMWVCTCPANVLMLKGAQR